MDLQDELMKLFRADGPQHVHFVGGRPIQGGNVIDVIADRLLALWLLAITPGQVAEELKALREEQQVVVLGIAGLPVFASLPEQAACAEWLLGSKEETRPRSNPRREAMAKGQTLDERIEDSILEVWLVLWREAEINQDNPVVGIVTPGFARRVAVQLGFTLVTAQKRVAILVSRGACIRESHRCLTVMRPPGGIDESPAFPKPARGLVAVQKRTTQHHWDNRRRASARAGKFREGPPPAIARRKSARALMAEAEFEALVARARTEILGQGDVAYFDRAMNPFLRERLGISTNLATRVVARLTTDRFCRLQYGGTWPLWKLLQPGDKVSE